MRKLKVKKEEVKKEEKLEEVDETKNLPFKKIDYVFYFLFFVVSILNETPVKLVSTMGIILIAIIIYNKLFKGLSNSFVYRIAVFFLLSLIALPVNLLIGYFRG